MTTEDEDNSIDPNEDWNERERREARVKWVG
jgi:hypothetical protein